MSASLPDNLPSVAKAKLPATYEQAKGALAECTRIDECADWANRAEALASYAKQAEDDSLRKMADRIQARAIRRCGELLRQIAPAKGGTGTLGGTPPQGSRSQAARDAGLSRDQKRTALRVAGIDADEFEDAVESDDPPTVTELAQRGTQRPIVDLKGRDPREYATATQAIGHLRRFAEFCETTRPDVIVRGSSAKERRTLAGQADQIRDWLKTLLKEIEA